MSWAGRRKLTYSIIFVGVILLALSPFLYKLYTPPNCFDGKQNQGELGIDCGGPCAKVCDFEVDAPRVIWQRFFEIRPNVYSAVAYIRNPNQGMKAGSAPYVFRFYDDNNQLLHERKGITFIGSEREFVVFDGPISIEEGSPRRVFFEFQGDMRWVSDEDRPLSDNLTIANVSLTKPLSSPRIDGIVRNRGISEVFNVELVALVYDDRGNAVAASRTVLSRLLGESSAFFFFSWPQPFAVEEDVCEIGEALTSDADCPGLKVDVSARVRID